MTKTAKEQKEIKAMFNQKIQRWDKSAVGAQIGGLLHDSSALAIAYMKNRPDFTPEEIMGKVMWFLDALYEIAEAKKLDIITPKPIDLEKAEKMGDEWVEKMNGEKGSYMQKAEEREIEEANLRANEITEQEKLNKKPF